MLTSWDILVSHETWNSASMMRPQHAVSLISIGPSLSDISYCYVDGIMYKMSPLNYQKKTSLSQPEEKYGIGSTKRSSSSPAKDKVVTIKIKGPSCCFVYRPHKTQRFSNSAAVAFMISISFFKTQNFSWPKFVRCKGLPSPTRWASNF